MFDLKCFLKFLVAVVVERATDHHTDKSSYFEKTVYDDTFKMHRSSCELFLTPQKPVPCPLRSLGAGYNKQLL